MSKQRVDRFHKISNNFFYNKGSLFKKIGGQKGFILYMLLTNRKNIQDRTYINKAEINNILKIDTNTSRARSKINNLLISLSDNNLIKFNQKILEASNNQFIETIWVDHFPNKEEGWIAYNSYDFEYYEKLGDLAYCLMWLMRMYEYYKTGTSFVPFDDMSKWLQASNRDVKLAIEKLENMGIMSVVRGGWQYDNRKKRSVRVNNIYNSKQIKP